MKELIPTEAMRNLALVGISKNSGKTTVLNHILASFPQYRWGVFSTGSDGEEKDQLFKTPKPQVILPSGALFCCEAETLDAHGSRVELLKSELYAGRKLYFAKALQTLPTQITGPSSVRRQKEVISLLRKLGACKVIVDGSLDRKSIALEDGIDALILCIGASFGSKEAIIEEIRRLSLLRDICKRDLSRHQKARLSEASSILFKRKSRWQDSGIRSLISHEKELSDLLDQGPEAIYIPTSLTDSLYAKLGGKFKESGAELIFRHPECLKLKLRNLKSFLHDNKVSSLIPFKIRAFTLNSTAVAANPVAADLFRSDIRAAFPKLIFHDVMELEYA